MTTSRPALTSQALVAVLLLALGLAPATAWAIGEQALMSVVGSKQGVIPWDAGKAGTGAIAVVAVGHELRVPFDAASGGATGKRQHSPLRVVKLPDRASPKLLTALVTNEALTMVELKFFRTVATGTVVLYHTFRLTNALIVGIETSGDTTAAGGVTETISFVYQKIEVIDNVNNTSAIDDWAAP